MSTGPRIEADLVLSSDDSTITVTGGGTGALVVSSTDWRPVVAGLRAGGVGPFRALRTGDRLARGGVTVQVEAAGRPLLTLGAGARSGRGGRGLGTRHLRVESMLGVLALLAPLARRRRPTA